MNRTKNRKRPIRVVFRLDESEAALLEQKMAEANILNREAYIRKMALDGYVLRIDFSDIRRMTSLLSNATNNLNQVAKRANETHSIHAEDIYALRADYDNLWAGMRDIMKKLAKL